MPSFSHDQYASLWARQLQREFEDICFNHQLRLPAPIIEIFDSSRHLGEWRQGAIRISTELILRHPWSVTINVLRHEMAHQLCAAWGEPAAGHGPRFQEACARLGVPPVYRTSRGDTPALFADLTSEDEMVVAGRRFFAKVEKLLALAQSANEHEATLAMQKANELIIKYNLGEQADDGDRRYRHLVINSGCKRIHGWQRSIAIILRDFFFVKIVLADAYDPMQDERHKTIDLFGRAENVAVAEYCYHFLVRELDFLWQTRKTRSGRGGITEKHSYYLGVLEGFRQTLKADQERARPPGPPPPGARAATEPATTSALIVARDHGLDEFLALCYPRLRKRQHGGSRINPATFAHGTADGKAIVLNKGVGHQDGNQGRLLPRHDG